MTELVHISARVEADTRAKLEEIARRRRMETGDAVTLADLIREALTEYTKRHQA